MDKKAGKVLGEFAARVRRRFPGARIWAFGSRVKGTSAVDSDLDVCVVLDHLNETVDREIMELAWKTGFKHDVVVSTVLYSRGEFEQGPCAQSPLVRNILQQGIAV